MMRNALRTVLGIYFWSVTVIPMLLLTYLFYRQKVKRIRMNVDSRLFQLVMEMQAYLEYLFQYTQLILPL